MVTAGKVFRLVESMPLPDLATKLSGYRREEIHEEGERMDTEVRNGLIKNYFIL